jgi:hypothetical protein
MATIRLTLDLDSILGGESNDFIPIARPGHVVRRDLGRIPHWETGQGIEEPERDAELLAEDDPKGPGLLHQGAAASGLLVSLLRGQHGYTVSG